MRKKMCKSLVMDAEKVSEAVKIVTLMFCLVFNSQ